MSLPDYAIEAIGLENLSGSVFLPEMRALKGIDLKIRRGAIFGLWGQMALATDLINILRHITKPAAR